MDYVVGSLEANVGLSGLTIAGDHQVKMTGETLDESALIRTVQNLQKSPVLKNLMIVSFKRAGRDPESGITFELSAQTVSMDHIRLPGERRAGQ